MRLNKGRKEFTVYIISVQDITGGLWRVQKRYSDFLQLHQDLKSSLPDETMKRIGKRPAEKLFQNHSGMAPSKTDKRRAALEEYLGAVLKETTRRPDLILRFLASDVVELMNKRQSVLFEQNIKEGYLTKKGRNFGGWKRRYFVLRRDVLEYYETQEHFAQCMDPTLDETISREPLGRIMLQNSRVAKQRQHSDDASRSNQYRHALMITEGPNGENEPKRNILCAESDQERDEWVYALARQVELIRIGMVGGDELASAEKLLRDTLHVKSPVVSRMLQERPQSTIEPPPAVADSQVVHHLEHIAEEMPEKVVEVKNPQPEQKQQRDSHIPSQPISAPNEGLPRAQDRSRASKLMDWASSQLTPRNRDSKATSMVSEIPEQRVFGIPLQYAIAYSKVKEGYELPAVVYRCIEFLDAHKAYLEEGIYRLSGSSAEIQNLKARFEKEGDVDLMKIAPEPDIHVVAGLFKLYLRELPDSILTNQLHRDFLHVLDLLDTSDRIIELARLVSQMPTENYTLLRALIAHLITIVQHSDSNKMTARNVGIVFSPSLSIPAGIFILMMAEFEFIFWVQNENDTKPRIESVYGAVPGVTVHAESVQKTEQPEEPSAQLRENWRRSKIEGRSNRNSQIYETNAPSILRNRESLILTNNEQDFTSNLTKEAETLELYDEVATPPAPISDTPSMVPMSPMDIGHSKLISLYERYGSVPDEKPSVVSKMTTSPLRKSPTSDAAKRMSSIEVFEEEVWDDEDYVAYEPIDYVFDDEATTVGI